MFPKKLITKRSTFSNKQKYDGKRVKIITILRVVGNSAAKEEALSIFICYEFGWKQIKDKIYIVYHSKRHNKQISLQL